VSDRDQKPGLDPDRAAAEASSRIHRPPPPVIDTRPYRRMIGGIGIAIAVVISALLFITHGGVGNVGIAPGQKLHWFVAPLAQYDIGKHNDANLNPRCNPADPNPKALNVCPWLANRGPLVLGFFVPADSDCTREVDTMQAVSRQFSGRNVRFAAVAVQVSQKSAFALRRSHHWTMPIAYDADGAVGEIYGIEVCPLVELAYRGGTVGYRLVGNKWLAPSELATKVRAIIR
jgi:hypothetical protein